jgi:3-hydroxybutyryl-CoA dehydrogenase
MNVEVKPGAASGTLLAEPPEIARVGVVGAGQMGNGIAHVSALAGLPVIMLDVKANALERAMGTIARNMDRRADAHPHHHGLRRAR